jgi:hypothetical protein
MKSKIKNVGFKDFIFEQPKQLTPQFCDQLINLYETHPKAIELRNSGETLGFQGQDALSIKQSEDLKLTGIPEFGQEDKILGVSLHKLLRNYIDYLSKTFNTKYNELERYNYQDSGFQIQKTTPGGFYNWHHDAFETRFFTYIYYLNDINNEGETQFSNGLKVKPEKGKALMFPATWEYLHRGIAPKDEIKYIATGWISAVYTHNSLEQDLELHDHI